SRERTCAGLLGGGRDSHTVCAGRRVGEAVREWILVGAARLAAPPAPGAARLAAPPAPGAPPLPAPPRNGACTPCAARRRASPPPRPPAGYNQTVIIPYPGLASPLRAGHLSGGRHHVRATPGLHTH